MPLDETAGDQSQNAGAMVEGRGLTIEASGDGGMITLRGEVLTAPGGELEVKPQFRDIYAYTSEGTLLVATGKLRDAHVGTFKMRLAQRGHQVRRTVEVDISTLKKVYAHAHNRRGATTQDANDALDVKMRRELVELIARGAKVGASDIHVTADKERAFVEMRIDGAMVPVIELPYRYAMQLMAAAYAMADSSDPTYTLHEPQAASIVNTDGRLPRNVQSVRLQWNPLVLGGRTLIMRLHGHGTARHKGDLDQLGYARSQCEAIRLMRQFSTGINLISGPTGSGKTTTLVHALAGVIRERRGEINCITVEDPPEYYIDGAKQMPVVNAATQEERKQKFLQAIVAALRSDPNVIMIGEIRDLESAKLAFAASMTGHAVWTSIHANNAVAIIDRLLDMGMEPYKVTDPDIVTGLIGQRLVRRLCPHCKVPLEQARAEGRIGEDLHRRTAALMERFGEGRPIFDSSEKGCARCAHKGFLGRTVAAEVVLPDERFMELVREHRKSEARAHWLENLGGYPMIAHAAAKMLRGELSPVDIEREVGLIRADAGFDRLPEILADME